MTPLEYAAEARRHLERARFLDNDLVRDLYNKEVDEAKAYLCTAIGSRIDAGGEWYAVMERDEMDEINRRFDALEW